MSFQATETDGGHCRTQSCQLTHIISGFGDSEDKDDCRGMWAASFGGEGADKGGPDPQTYILGDVSPLIEKEH